MHFRKYSNIALLPILLMGSGIVHSDTSKLSIALNAGKTMTSIKIPVPAGASLSIKDQEALGFTLGYRFNENLSAEFEMTKGGATLNASGPGGSVSADIDIDTIALYATSRTSGDLFIKFKFGLIKEEISASSIPSESDTGLSYGLGAGYKINDNFSIEAEYIMVEEDVSWALISGRFTFGP